MNFMFSWPEQYLTRSLHSLVRYCSCHSNIKFISSRHRVISSIYQKFWKKVNCWIFSRLLNVSAWITFWMLHIKANSVFHLFNVFLHFRGQSAKKRVCNLSYSISVKSYRTFFEIGFNKYGVFVQKLLLKKSIEIKNLRTRFLFFICWSVCDTKQIFLPIWKAFQNTQEWHFSFWKYIFILEILMFFYYAN